MIIVLIMTLASGTITAQNNAQVILDNYIKLKDALVKSDIKQASLNASELSKSLENDGKHIKPHLYL
mgnify:CR=1 FL=1